MNRSKQVLIAIVLTVLGLVAAACNQAMIVPVAESDDAIRQIIKDYKSWTRVAENRDVSMWLMTLCRLPTEEDELFAEVHKGMISVYVNPVAVAPMTKDESPVFPVGSVIVKEKQQTDADGKNAETEWGLMIKRDKGFNPNGGDWEYLYVDADNKVSRDSELQHCQSCHYEQGTDSVFTHRYRQ